MSRQATQVLSQPRRDDEGDTIFDIDVQAETILLDHCERWGRDEPFLLMAEGLPARGLRFGRGEPRFRLICDPIDGTRGLMFDKRSAWCLLAIAPEKGDATRLLDVELALMGELPNTRMHVVDTLWAERSSATRGLREDLVRGTSAPLVPRPSGAIDLRHGFASVANFFPGGKELTARLDDALMQDALGGWNPDKCEVYGDQYISSGGQLAELALGRDRFVLDVRPLVHAALCVKSSLCSRPYDVCTALVARNAGCVVTAPTGSPLDPPLDVTSDVAFVGYANAGLAERLQPLVVKWILAMLGEGTKPR